MLRFMTNFALLQTGDEEKRPNLKGLKHALHSMSFVACLCI